MVNIVVTVEDETLAQLERLARDRCVSVDEIVERAIEHEIVHGDGPRIFGMFRSGYHDTAERSADDPEESA